MKSIVKFLGVEATSGENLENIPGTFLTSLCMTRLQSTLSKV